MSRALRPFGLAVREGAAFARQHGVVNAVRLAVRAVRTVGTRGLIRRAAAEERQREDETRYAAWVQTHTPAPTDLEQLWQEVARLPYQPRLSVITAVFNTDPGWLQRCIGSVRAQVYPNWELCICDDGSTDGRTIETLREYVDDSRVRAIRSARNEGIVQASNAALSMATGEYVAFLDHDDELAPDALAEIVRALNDHPKPDIVYTDEDKIDECGARRQPHFKPDWSPDLLRSCMYLSHLSVIRRTVVESVGGFRNGTDGAQDYDLMLRATTVTDRIAHVPKVLYHWRMSSGSAASSRLAKTWAMDAARSALRADLQRRGLEGDVLSTDASGHFHMRYAIKGHPLVSILIAGNGGGGEDRKPRWPEDLVRRATYGEHELLAVRDGALRAAAQAARGDHLLVVRSSIAPLAPDWIERLLELSQQPEIGAVGCITLFQDGTIENGGLALPYGAVLPELRGEPAWTRGHMSNIVDVRNCAAVSGTCLMTSRAAYADAGGFNDDAGELWDVDYCLRVRAAGRRVVVTPHARVRHLSAARSSALAERRLPEDRWNGLAERDPYYNPNFDRSAATFRLPDARQ